MAAKQRKCRATATSLALLVGSANIVMIMMMMDHIELRIGIGAQFLLSILCLIYYLSLFSLHTVFLSLRADDKSALKSESFFV